MHIFFCKAWCSRCCVHRDFTRSRRCERCIKIYLFPWINKCSPLLQIYPEVELRWQGGRHCGVRTTTVLLSGMAAYTHIVLMGQWFVRSLNERVNVHGVERRGVGGGYEWNGKSSEQALGGGIKCMCIVLGGRAADCWLSSSTSLLCVTRGDRCQSRSWSARAGWPKSTPPRGHRHGEPWVLIGWAGSRGHDGGRRSPWEVCPWGNAASRDWWWDGRDASCCYEKDKNKVNNSSRESVRCVDR